jgi:hypothetical protein
MMSSCESKELNHLGLVSGMYDELDIGKTIDALIPQDMTQRKLSIGQILKGMVLNGLGFANQRLYLMPHFFEGKPVENLLGQGVLASDLNDDVTGRMLDSVYEAGASDMYAVIAKKALKQLDLSCFMGHMDSTTFHTDGAYDYDEEEGVINITKGYSRDHRPELNQFGLKLIVESRAGIPMMMEALSGNDNDKTRFKETIRDHIGQLPTPSPQLIGYPPSFSVDFFSQNTLNHKEQIPMKEIIRALSSIDNILNRKTFNQLNILVEAILSMTGRVTMLGMSRWSEDGGSYRTIQRFFGLPDIPWVRMNWLVSRLFLQDKDDVILFAGDEVVVTKSGKETFGVGRFFLLFRVKSCRACVFYP